MPIKCTVLIAHVHVRKDDAPEGVLEKYLVELAAESMEPGACPHEIQAVEALKAACYAIKNNLNFVLLSGDMLDKITPKMESWLRELGYKEEDIKKVMDAHISDKGKVDVPPVPSTSEVEPKKTLH